MVTYKSSKDSVHPKPVPLLSIDLQKTRTEKSMQPKHSVKTISPLLSVTVCPKCSPSGHHKCEAHAKDGQTELLSDRDRSQQSRSISESSETNPASIKQDSKSCQLRKSDDKSSQAQNMSGKTEKASTHSKEEKKCESITGDHAEQLTNTSVCSAAESDGVKEKDQPENVSKCEMEQNGSAADDKPVASSDVSAEHLTGTIVAVEVVRSTDLLQPEMIVNTEHKLKQLSQSPLSAAHTNDSRHAAASQDGKPDVAHTEVPKGQSYDSIASSEATTARLIELSRTDIAVREERNEREMSSHEMQRGQSGNRKQSEHAVKNDRRVKRSQPLEWDRALCDRSKNRESSSAEKTRSHATDDKQRGTRRKDWHYIQDASYSHQDRFTQQESWRTKQHGTVPESLCYDKPMSEVKHRDYVSDLDDISSDEEIIEYKDHGNHSCWFCSETYETIPSLLEHLQGSAHEQVFIIYLPYITLPMGWELTAHSAEAT